MNTNDVSFIIGIAVGSMGTMLLEILALIFWLLFMKKEDNDDE